MLTCKQCGAVSDKVDFQVTCWVPRTVEKDNSTDGEVTLELGPELGLDIEKAELYCDICGHYSPLEFSWSDDSICVTVRQPDRDQEAK